MARKDQLRLLENDLRKEEARLKHTSRNSSDNELGAMPGDVAEAGQWQELATSVSQDQEVKFGQLREIEDALKRISDETYGKCFDCTKNIPITRLAAKPTAERCVECQSEFEQNGSSSNGSMNSNVGWSARSSDKKSHAMSPDQVRGHGVTPQQ